MKRKYYTYALYEGKRKVYIGYTDDLQNIFHEHEGESKKFTRVEKTSKAMSLKSVLIRKEEQLVKYRYGHNGKNPRDNEEE